MKKLFFSLYLWTILISSQAMAEIPFNQSIDVYKKTNDQWKSISPFWGMVALHSKMLERIRFFGPYDTIKDKQGRDSDQGLDAIAQLIKELFPSPDGVQFVANTRDKDPVGNLSRQLEKINNVIEILVTVKKPMEQREKIIAIFKKMGKTSSGANEKFADLLIKAYQEQDQLANPSKPNQQLYPENIVVISLLAFFCKVADDNNEFEKLPFLMQKDFNPQQQFTRDDYFSYRKQGLQVLSDIVTHSLTDPELAFLMAKGYEVYENTLIEPIQYRSDTCYLTSQGFPDCGETSLRNILMILLSQQGVISEDTLIALQKNIKLQPDANLNDPYSSFQKMITFFRANPLIADASIKKTHDQWAKIVSNLNEEQKQQSLESIAYGRGGKKDQPHTYEIKADFSAIGVKGIINMLNVLAKLIPDQQLNEKWDQDEKKRYLQAAQKLTRLCELFSRNNHFVSWVNANSNDQKIKNPFPTITLIINDQPAYYWRFKPGHFQLDPIGADRDDWRSAYKARRNFGNDWMASLFSRLHYRDSDAGFPKEQLPPLDLVYHREIKSINGAIEAITMVLDQKMDQFYPLIGRWIQKSIPLNDQYSLVKVSTLLYGWKENEAIKELLKKPSFIRIKKLVEENIERNQGNAFLLAAKFGYPQSILKLLEEDPFLIDVTDHENKRTALHYAVAQGHKAAANLLIEKKPQIINAKDNDGLTAVHLAIENGNTKLLALLISKRASIQERDNSDFLPIHHAAGHGREQAITLLINAGASVTEKSEGGMTPLHHAVAYGRTNVIDLLLKYGAKVEEKTDDGLAPLHIAASTINVAMLNLLIQKGADVNVKDNKNKTPLHHLTAGIGSVVERDTALAIAKLLIHYGVEVNAQDKKGQTPLHLAVSYGLENRDVIELLLNNGAQITIKDKKSQTPLDLALQDQDSALIDLLKKFTPKAP